MLGPDEIRVREYERLIADAAYKFRRAAEYDDLYQEGMIAVWSCPPDADPAVISTAIFNRMKDWVRYIKRLRHMHSVSYEEIMNHGVREGHSRDVSEEL
jgi:DNA-directed RNA polymerase specialized sigma24 family protein